MRALLTMGALCSALLTTAAAQAAVVSVPMDQQINIGAPGTAQSPNSDAIYTLKTSPNGSPSVNLSWETDGTEGFTRAKMPGNRNTDPGLKTGWYYVYLDNVLAIGGNVDLSAPDSTIEFDARFFNDPVTNSSPYGDAVAFLRLYSYGIDGNTLLGYRDYNVVYRTQAPDNDPRYPDWAHVVVDVHNAPNITTSGAFDTSKVTRMRWYGTNWAGSGDDFIDLKDVVYSGNNVIPEPGTMALMAMGALPLLGLRRRKA